MENPPPVELDEDEFHRVYTTLRNCLAREVGVDRVDCDDATFLRSCLEHLDTEERDERYFHLRRGFLPLFERLTQAMATPKGSDGAVTYRVTFS